MIHSAMILAAGRGERMRPLTDHTPKALIPVAGKPLIVYHLEKLSRLDIKNIIINISYLADNIREALGDGTQFDVNITYSYEPEALETGGGIYQALPLLGDKPFLVISSDIFTDYDFGNLLNKNIKHLAHLILAPNPGYHPKGDFSLGSNGFVKNIPEYTYASMGVFHPNLFRRCQPGRFSVVPLLIKAIANQQVTGELYQGLWHNVGTIEELKLLELPRSVIPVRSTMSKASKLSNGNPAKT